MDDADWCRPGPCWPPVMSIATTISKRTAAATTTKTLTQRGMPAKRRVDPPCGPCWGSGLDVVHYELLRLHFERQYVMNKA